MSNSSHPTVAIAHDWLIRYAGSERVVEQIMTQYPESTVLTSLARETNLPAAFAGRVRPSILQSVPFLARNHEYALPLMPLSWKVRRPLSGIDIVISSSHACAKAVRIAKGVPHICYCHTPMRYAWDFESEKHRFPSTVRPLVRSSMGVFRHWDRSSARNVTRFLANSSYIADRVRKCYGRIAHVLAPPVDTEFYSPDLGVQAAEQLSAEPYFLYVGRLVSYKRADLVVEAFRESRHRLIVVGDGQLSEPLRRLQLPNVTFISGVSDLQLRTLYRHAVAMVFPAIEDFGIAMAEAQSCGTPVIGVNQGGAVDIVRDGGTGYLIPPNDLSALQEAVDLCHRASFDRTQISLEAARFSHAAFRQRLQEHVQEVLTNRRAGAR